MGSVHGEVVSVEAPKEQTPALSHVDRIRNGDEHFATWPDDAMELTKSQPCVFNMLQSLATSQCIKNVAAEGQLCM
jgi:hypothetical protein